MKTWYAAHIVMVVHFTRAKQTTYPAWENVVLIAASSEDEAFRKADAYAAEEEAAVDESFRWGKHPASLKYAGVRKLTECRFLTDEPCDLGEATYIDLEFSSEGAVKNYIAGNDQRVKVRNPFPEAAAPAVMGALASKETPKRKRAKSTSVNH
jgi:hypothetical protein